MFWVGQSCPYICTVYDHILDDFHATYTVYAPYYIYGSGQPYVCLIASNLTPVNMNSLAKSPSVVPEPCAKTCASHSSLQCTSREIQLNTTSCKEPKSKHKTYVAKHQSPRATNMRHAKFERNEQPR